MAKDQKPGAPRTSRINDAARLEVPPTQVCPYLLAAGGGWRSSAPSREHRCTAVAPPIPLDAGKQRRLCLVPGHATCATYLAALAARRERGASPAGDSPARWPVARTTPIVDVGVGLGATISSVLAERRGWQAIPALVLVLALGAVGVSSIGRDQSAAVPTSSAPVIAVATAAPAPGRTAGVTPGTNVSPSPSAPAPTDTPVPTPVATPVRTSTPPPRPTSTPVPSARTTYTVKAGDTLYEIAGTFGTTVAAIKELNGLTSNNIRTGLVLLIP